MEKPTKAQETRFYQNSSGAIIPVFGCFNCIWGVRSDNDQLFCTMKEKVAENISEENPFPEFCELPTKEKLQVDSVQAMRMACNLLNEAFSLDPAAVDSLITLHVVCNEKMADHPTVQVRQTGKDRYTMGMLGFLNGLSDGDHYLIANIEEQTGKLLGFSVVDRSTIDTALAKEKLDGN